MPDIGRLLHAPFRGPVPAFVRRRPVPGLIDSPCSFFEYRELWPAPLHAMARGQRPTLSTYVVVLRSRVGMNTGSPTPLAANAVVSAQPSSCGTEHDLGRLRYRKAYCTTCRDGFVCPSHWSLIDRPRSVFLIRRLAQILRFGYAGECLRLAPAMPLRAPAPPTGTPECVSRRPLSACPNARGEGVTDPDLHGRLEREGAREALASWVFPCPSTSCACRPSSWGRVCASSGSR